MNDLTCFEMTSGERGVSFEGSMSTFGMGSERSSCSESESSWFGIMSHVNF